MTKVILMQATTQQQEWVHSWLAESPRHRDDFDDLRLLLEPVGQQPSLGNMSRLIQVIRRKQALSAQRRRLAAALILFLTIIGGVAAYAWRPPHPVTLRDASLAEVCALLHTQYGIDIQVSPGLKGQWSGSFWQPAAEDVVPLLARSIDATYTRSGDKYTLSPP